MQRSILALDTNLTDHLTRNIKERADERRRIEELLADVKQKKEDPYKALAHHARGWLMIVRPVPSLPTCKTSQLLPLVDAWIEHKIDLNPSAPGMTLLHLNTRIEQAGLHISAVTVRKQNTGSPPGWTRKRWYTFVHSGLWELLIDDIPILFAFSHSHEDLLWRSGIENTHDDQPQTPYDYRDVRNHFESCGWRLAYEPEAL